jgi:predicted MFS family arabinose efflux permease
VFAVGLVLLGLPVLALPFSTSLAAILGVCVVRGLGFAIIVVVGSALVASLVSADRRGEGLGLYGVVVGIPSVVALPLGVWLAGHVGYPQVFIAGAIAALGGLLVVLCLPGRQPSSSRPIGILSALRTPALVRPSIVFSLTAMAAGVIVTFLPLAVTGASTSLAALALLAHAAATTTSRWWAGRYGDRHGPAGLLVPGVLAAATGMLALVLIASPVAVVGGMVVFGFGFGVTQNATLALMFDRAPVSGYGAVSALWNLAYDGGLGVGAAGFGLIATHTGDQMAFALTATLVLVAVVPALRDRAKGVRYIRSGELGDDVLGDLQ